MTINHRYEFVYLFDVMDGNPNGDPDAGNLPRTDSETGHGIVTDVCLKRKIRNYITISKGEGSPYSIFIKEKAILNDLIAEGKQKGNKKVEEAREWMCRNYYDIRSFGAVMTTGENCGQVRGPVQITFARSIDPIVTVEHTITRMAVATKAEAEKQNNENRTMGRKHTVPYGLYRVHGFISAHLAAQTGFSDQDLELLWAALRGMFDHDHSAARGLMSARGLFVFKHESPLGNASAHELFDLVNVRKKPNIVIPREFSHYEVSFNQDALSKKIVCERMI